MKAATMLGSFVALAIILMGGAMAEPQRQHGGETHRPAPPHPAETHAGPRGYDRVAEPHGWNTRPANFDRGAYQHNFQAARRFSIGAYHRPAGWVARRWAFDNVTSTYERATAISCGNRILPSRFLASMIAGHAPEAGIARISKCPGGNHDRSDRS